MTIEKKVRNFKTKYKEGFTQDEINTLLGDFPDLDLNKFYNALKAVTGIFVKGKMIVYRSDIVTALHCGIEKRDLRSYEWD